MTLANFKYSWEVYLKHNTRKEETLFEKQINGTTKINVGLKAILLGMKIFIKLTCNTLKFDIELGGI